MEEEKVVALEKPKRKGGWPKGKPRKELPDKPYARVIAPLDRETELKRIAELEAEKKQRRRAKSPAIDNQLAKTIKRLSYATKGLGAISPELLKAAALQMVMSKLEEVAQLLKMVTPNGNSPPAPMSQAGSRALTLENVDRLVARTDAQARQHTGPTCKICGMPAIGKNDRGMDLCAGHLGVDRQQFANQKLAQMIKKGFGGSTEEREVIQVEAGTIQQLENQTGGQQ